MGPADAFAAAIAASGLTRFRRIEHHVATRSTNDDAQGWLADPACGGLVIVADEQTAGRGRRGRRWVAPPKSGLLFTAILPEPIAARDAWAVTFWSGLRVAEAIRGWNVAATLQWPNDLLVEGRKLCGILCVSRVVADRATIGCGVGVNVYRPARHPELDEIVPPPIFLDDVAVVAERGREELLIAILRAFETGLASLRDPEGIAREWERHAGLPGARYRFVFDDGGEVEGEALRVARGGGLIVRTGGAERTIELAERVRVLR
jgi:BirA family biotin operon repressor/biotin-[acetyl-CoA-carboxylase] ligase